MKRPTLAALAATVALPLLAAPAAAQMGPYGYTPSDDFRYDWRPGDIRDRADDRWSNRPGSHGGPDGGRAYYGVEPFDDDRRRAHGPYGSTPYTPETYITRWDYERMRDEMRRAQRDAYERGLRDARSQDEQVGRGRDRREHEHRAGMGGHMSGGHHGMMRGRMARGERLLELYDGDGDGRVTQEEVDTYRRDRLAEFDRDGDQVLTLQEYEALYLDAMREAMVDRFQEHDADGDGRVTVEEFSRGTRGTVSRWDRDGDEAVSREDFMPRRRMSARGDVQDYEWQGRPEVEAPLGNSPNEPDAPVPAEEDDADAG